MFLTQTLTEKMSHYMKNAFLCKYIFERGNIPFNFLNVPVPRKHLNNPLKSSTIAIAVPGVGWCASIRILQTDYNFSSGRTRMKSHPKGHEKRRMGPCIDYRARQGACHVWYKWNSCLWWLLPGLGGRMSSLPQVTAAGGPNS